MKATKRSGWMTAATVAFTLAAAHAQAAETRWELRFDGFFQSGKKPLFIYARQQGEQWLVGVGSSRDPDRQGGKTFNRSWYYGDLSGAPLKDGAMTGRVVLHLTPDLWVPYEHRGYAVTVEVDAKTTADGGLDGTYKVVDINSTDRSSEGLGRAGKLTGKSEAKDNAPLPEPVTYQCNMQGSLVGGDPTFGDRCMVLWLGMEGGKLVAAAHGGMSQKFETFGRTPFEVGESTLALDGEVVRGTIVVPTKTLDMEPCRYVFALEGRRMDGLFVGTYALIVKVDGKPDVTINGSFDGNASAGIRKESTAVDARPWFAPVAGFKAPAAGEHPRLLFRKSDVAALREKAKTPEGQAILKRLRYLLNGGDGETMTTEFSVAKGAYTKDDDAQVKGSKGGLYTLSHAAGYGLLYQLTGDRKYAEFGKQCFDKAFEGVRDRDDRYSWKAPGGALRAGPALGWYAVGYDLCYDGWDAATRERIGRAFMDYSEGAEGKPITLEALARGTMPPGSNHFGMQVGGMALVLLALTGEPWADQAEIDKLLAIVEGSLVRNLTEGFGDGGFFAEGDGTGSMSSHIAYLSGLQAMRNAAGRDYINVERPNARMTALKWIYLTVVRGGSPDFWPIRGAYGHNAWSRGDKSGAGYFAIGMAAVTDEQKAAMKGYYNHFLLEADTQAGAPYDTVSVYPHLSVCAFVNWPLDIPERNPAEVLPLCYRDSSCGFYGWRNRWQDGQDTVISVLQNRTSGYMGAKPDGKLYLNSLGKHTTWGTVSEGATKHWWTSPRGETSSLTLDNGTALAVDFTGASGADTMLVTTGKAEGQTVKVDGKDLTFYFPTAAAAPEVKVEGAAAVVGKQKVSLKDGNLELSVQTR